MNRDMLFGGASLAFAVAYYWLADGIPTSALSDAVGPGGLPKSYALVLGGLSLLLILRAAMQRRRAGMSGDVDGEGRRTQLRMFYRVAGVLGIGALYVVAVHWLGYVITLALLIAATAYYQGGVLNRQLGVVAIAGALFFWFLFVYVLHIPQPPGLWPDLF